MADHSLEARHVPQERQSTLLNDLKTQYHVSLASQRCGLLLSRACGFLQGSAFLQGPSTSWLKAGSVYITVQRILVMKTDTFCFYLFASLISPLGYVLLRAAGATNGSGHIEETSTRNTP